MKLSDISMGQLDEEELGRLNGLGLAAAPKKATPVSKGGMSHLQKKPAAQTQPALPASTEPDFSKFDTNIVAELYAAAQKGEGHVSFYGTLSAEQVKAMKDKIEAEYNKRKGAIQKAEQAVTVTGGDAGAGTSAGAGGGETSVYGKAGFDFGALLKNPWYWAGVAVVVGGLAYLFMRSRRSTAPVAPVQTMGLEELEGVDEQPKRKRRRRRKAKKHAGKE